MSPLSPVIELKGICKSYNTWKGRFEAVKKVDLTVPQGKVVGLLGPNGAGKTTIVKLILGLARPSKGEFKLFGKAGVSSAQKERLGFLPEQSHLYDFLSIKETVTFAAKLYKNRDEALKRVDEVIDQVGLKGRDHFRISQCSKGMARRAALAQSLIHDPELLLLDEPTSGFDPVGIADMKKLILSLRNAGKSILVCSHQLADVEAVCDEVYILNRGRVLVQGDIKNLLSDDAREAVVVDKAQAEELKNWLNEKGFAHEEGRVGKLEDFFMKIIRKDDESSLNSIKSSS